MYEHELAAQFSCMRIRDAVMVPLVGLATIESFRLVSHGCGVPASLRDEVRAAQRSIAVQLPESLCCCLIVKAL
jgi:hypothetical protein